MKLPETIFLNSAELAKQLAGDEKNILLDVRPEVDFNQVHIRGGQNNCVYEIQFEERLAKIIPDTASPVCVYGHDSTTHDARMAAEKLGRLGYQKIFALREGICGWIDAEMPVDKGSEAASPSAAVLEGKHYLDLEESKVEWIGRNLLNRHRGTIGISAGEIHFEENIPVRGHFTLQMNDLHCENLQGDPLHDVLINHLKSHDFFDTSVYPTAEFTLLSSALSQKPTPGAPNIRINGELTIKGITRPLSFDAVSGLSSDGKFGAQASLSFDRTQWNVIYGSGKFFHNLGMHLVNDLIELHLRIATRASD